MPEQSEKIDCIPLLCFSKMSEQVPKRLNAFSSVVPGVTKDTVRVHIQKSLTCRRRRLRVLFMLLLYCCHRQRNASGRLQQAAPALVVGLLQPHSDGTVFGQRTHNAVMAPQQPFIQEEAQQRIEAGHRVLPGQVESKDVHEPCYREHLVVLSKLPREGRR